MYLELDHDQHDHYIRVVLKADNKIDTSREIWARIFSLCQKTNMKSVLVISDSEPVEIVPAYQHADIVQQAGFTFDYRVAWIEKNAAAYDIDAFIENVLFNRGIIQAKLFRNEEDALGWLLQ
jgi:hypothetical protein